MRNIFKIALLSTGILSLSSCSDFLNQTSSSEQGDELVFSSVSSTNWALNKVYGNLTLDETYSQFMPIIGGLNSDCELVDGLGNDAVNTSSERGNMNYNANPGWASIAKVWDAMYAIIENTNIIVKGIDESELITTEGSDKRAMLRYKGEALTLRAMAYYDLIKLFGDIPMSMETSKSDLSNAYIAKTDRDEIMDRLISDLEEAIEFLPWAGESGYSTEHVTKGYAHALLANIALSRAGWNIREKAKDGYETASFSDATYPTQRCDAAKKEEMYKLALTHLSQVINSGKHQLNPSVANQWYQINQLKLDETYRENIFEIPMGLSKSGELGYTVGVRINGASSKYGAKGNSSGKLKLTAPYFWSFDAKDLRRDLTCANYQLKESNGSLKEEMLGNTPFAIYCAKWDIRKMSESWRQMAINTGNAKWMSGINVVKMRYPQVLLMYAEAMNELYGPNVAGQAGLSAKDALEQVHTRAFADANKAAAKQYVASVATNKEDLFNAIVQENAWELAGEGFRKFDLIRWNLLSEKIDKFKADYKNQVENEYPEKVYFKYNADYSIDMASVCWYKAPDDTNGYENKDFFGKEKTAKDKTQLDVNLPSICSGLNSVVKNRYLLPIASTTISASNGTLQNAYGYSN